MSAKNSHSPNGDPPNRIKELRQEARKSQEFIAKKIGVSKVTISELERGLLPLTLKYMRGIASVLEVKPADLLVESDNPASLTAWERYLIDCIRNATPDERARIIAILTLVLPPCDPPIS